MLAQNLKCRKEKEIDILLSCQSTLTTNPLSIFLSILQNKGYFHRSSAFPGVLHFTKGYYKNKNMME